MTTPPKEERQRQLTFSFFLNPPQESFFMTKHRVLADIPNGTAQLVAAEVVQVDGTAFYKAHDRSLRPVDTDRLHSGENYISSRWHDDRADAYAEVAEELGRRSQQLAALRLICLAGQEVAHV
jgi:hypothetical protein